MNHRLTQPRVLAAHQRQRIFTGATSELESE
jgi:hypothetical protein